MVRPRRLERPESLLTAFLFKGLSYSSKSRCVANGVAKCVCYFFMSGREESLFSFARVVYPVHARIR
jgi:hypothetical protein